MTIDNENETPTEESTIPPTTIPKILVIDDEEGFRKMLSYNLTDEGYQVSTASNGHEAIQMEKMQKFDVVISDLTMPKMGGLDALPLLKEIDPKIEVIIVTGFATVETAIQSMKCGAYDYITKPYQMEDLFRLVSRAIDKRRLNLRVDQLQELNRLKSEFLANMSHELRTPMNAIIGYTSLVVDGIYGEISQKIKQPLLRVGTNAKNLLQLINNILDLSKLTAGRMPVYNENCDLAELAREVVDTLSVLANEKKLSLVCESREGICISTDKTKLKQVLINLVGNGIKFTSQGGVSIMITQVENEPCVQIQVKDTGLGIKPEEIPELFHEFKQLDSSSTREFGGTGLGLCISKKLVELLGGHIRVESSPNSGSSFTVSLPAENKVNTQSVISPIPSQIIDPSKKILLAIDDDPEVLVLLRDSLKGSGFSFTGAQNGEEGLALARQLHPSVITLDIMMPHMDGWSVLNLIKNDPQLASIPVIILSIMENKALGFSLGIADYIIKPFDRQTLLDKLKFLDKKRAEADPKDNTTRVLVVDGDANMAEFFQEAFKKDGLNIVIVKNGADALASMAEVKPDLLFLDLMGPQVNGFDILQITQKDPVLKDIPTIVTTAQHLTPQEKEYLEKRVAMIVQKESINLPDVLAAVNEKISSLMDGTK